MERGECYWASEMLSCIVLGSSICHLGGRTRLLRGHEETDGLAQELIWILLRNWMELIARMAHRACPYSVSQLELIPDEIRFGHLRHPDSPIIQCLDDQANAILVEKYLLYKSLQDRNPKHTAFLKPQSPPLIPNSSWLEANQELAPCRPAWLVFQFSTKVPPVLQRRLGQPHGTHDILTYHLSPSSQKHWHGGML